MDIFSLGQPISKAIDATIVVPVASAMGQRDDYIRLYVVFLLQYPLGWLMYYKVKGVQQRHAFVSIIGILIQLYMYGSEIMHNVLLSYGAYALMLVAPREKQTTWVTAWVFSYLTYNHWDAYMNRFMIYDMGITTYTMLQVLKLQALAWCYRDGATDPEKLTKDQRLKMVVQAPSLLEFTSYTFFCQTAALGVFFEYRDFIAWIECKDEYKSVPDPIIPSLKWLGQSLTFLTIFAVMTPYIPIDYCWSDGFADHPFLWKVGFYWLAFTVKRTFYYSPFCATTGAICACGLGYNGVKTVKDHEEHQWDKIIGVYWVECERMTSPAEVFRYWNYQVHVWLKGYVYMRLITPGQKPGTYESMMTFCISSLWHGFYVFYHIMFFFAACLQELAKDIYKSHILFKGVPKPVKVVTCWFFTYLTLNYCGINVVALSLKNGLAFNAAMYYFVFILILVSLALFRFKIMPYARKLEKKLAGEKPTLKEELKQELNDKSDKQEKKETKQDQTVTIVEEKKPQAPNVEKIEQMAAQVLSEVKLTKKPEEKKSVEPKQEQKAEPQEDHKKPESVVQVQKQEVEIEVKNQQPAEEKKAQESQVEVAKAEVQAASVKVEDKKVENKPEAQVQENQQEEPVVVDIPKPKAEVSKPDEQSTENKPEAQQEAQVTEPEKQQVAQESETQPKVQEPEKLPEEKKPEQLAEEAKQEKTIPDKIEAQPTETKTEQAPEEKRAEQPSEEAKTTKAEAPAEKQSMLDQIEKEEAKEPSNRESNPLVGRESVSQINQGYW